MPESSVEPGGRFRNFHPVGRILRAAPARTLLDVPPVAGYSGHRAVCVLLASLLLALSGLVLAALPASADFGKAPDATVGANDRVSAIVRVGDRIYLGGRFTAITTKDGQSIPRNGLAAIDANTGEVVADWNPNAADGTVRAMALSADGKRLYVGGSFTSVGGRVRNNLAAIDLATGTVDRGWSGGTNEAVWALAVSDSGVYAGGNFTAAKGQPRTHLAKFDVTTGALDPNWSPSADQISARYGSVRALEFSGDMSRLYVGGYFQSISGQQTGNVAALDPTTGALDGAFRTDEVNGIQSMAVEDGRVFVGTGDDLEGIVAFDGSSGQRVWRLGFGDHSPGTGDVQAMTIQDGTLYAGGHFDKMHDLWKHRLVAVDAATGVIDSQWNPNVAAGNAGVWALEAYGPYLYAGGDFTEISGQTQERFAQFTYGPDQPDMGLTGEYFNNMDFTGTKVTRTDSTLDFAWGNFSPVGIDANTFSARWTGQVKPKYSETYTFYTTSDDGVRLWVNGQRVIDNWTNHSPTVNSGQITLTAGQLYDIRMEYFENTGGAVAKLEWSSASEPRWLVPQNRLYPAVTSP